MRQALADALRAGESNTSVGGASAVAGGPVAPAPVPPQYLCPITGELMEDPVTTADRSGRVPLQCRGVLRALIGCNLRNRGFLELCSPRSAD